jgi:Fe2+ transport system protein FeoA
VIAHDHPESRQSHIAQVPKRRRSAAYGCSRSSGSYNEYLYVRIMRLQAAAAGRPEAVRRTLALLESRLTELGITPGTQTRQAAAALLGAAGPGPGRVGSADQ